MKTSLVWWAVCAAVEAALPRDLSLVEQYLRLRAVTRACLLHCSSSAGVVGVLRGSPRFWAAADVSRGVAARSWRCADPPATRGPLALVLHSSCSPAQADLLLTAMSSRTVFSGNHVWLWESREAGPLPRTLAHLSLSIDADLVVAVPAAERPDPGRYLLTDVFNFGAAQGGPVQTRPAGHWAADTGLVWSRPRYKYYGRWNFCNLTLRAVTVVSEGRWRGREEELREEAGGARGVSAMTRVSARLLHVLADTHNFRFNYTVVDRWVASPHKNATPGVTNTLYWRQQDISVTCLRIFSSWLDWMDPFMPPTYKLETRFYYVSSGTETGENMFVRPLSRGAWAATGAAGLLSAGVLLCGATAQRHPRPLHYAVFSVVAALGQQAYEDGVQLLETRTAGSSRRAALLVLGTWSLLVYNYYTSSVVSWLLVADPPRLKDLLQLARSDLRLLFQDIGYTRSWLQSPGFYYYAGYARPEEDHLRATKVSEQLVLYDLRRGLDLVRTGGYAYHAEPEEVSAVLGGWPQSALCQLGALSMMPPSPVYVVGQRHSPYREFFNWRLLRLAETGSYRRSARIAPAPPPRCESRPPRPLALAPALPAFLLLASGALLSVTLLIGEVVTHRRQKRSDHAHLK